VITVIALVDRRPRVHEVIAPVMAVAIIGFFAFLFWRI